MLRDAAVPYRVEECPVDQAVVYQRIASGEVDACILDHTLSTESGTEILRRLPDPRQLPPVVVLTGSPDPRVADEYLELGAADFLCKGEITPRLLDCTIRYAMRHWNDRRVLERHQQALLRSERMATIGRIATGVAHEYNNLNAVILGNLERLQRRLGELHPDNHLIERLVATVERSRGISGTLLKLGRPTQGPLVLTDLRKSIIDSLTLLEPPLRSRGMHIALTIPDQPCWVAMERNEIHQVIDQVVTNAVHALWQRDEPRIGVLLDTKGQIALLEIADNGIGIAGDDLTRIFDPFFSRKGAYDREQRFAPDVEGTGLGLALCQSLIEQADGTIEALSGPDTGTTIRIRLPLQPEPMPVAAGRPSERRRKRVAIVEDNLPLLELIREALTHAGHEVLPFSEPEPFLRLAPTDEFDVLLLDWQLPRIDGGEMLQLLGAMTWPRPLPVVIISGSAPPMPAAVPGLRLGPLIPKPFAIRTLLDILDGIEPAGA